MILSVHVEGWHLEEDGRILRVGDDFGGWLFFEEEGRCPMPNEWVQEIVGRAEPIGWDWHEIRRHPVQVDLGPAALYWDAPEYVVGDVRLMGRVKVDSTDAPEGFPTTHGTIRRIRMEWREYVLEACSWQCKDDQARFEDVPASYLPTHDFEAEDLAPDAMGIREAVRHQVAKGQPFFNRSFIVVPASPEPELSLGATRTLWTGVLLDLEVTGTVRG